MQIQLTSIVKTEGKKETIIAIVSQSPSLVELQETRKLENLTIGQLRTLKDGHKVITDSNGWESVKLVDFQAELSEEVVEAIYECRNAESV